MIEESSSDDCVLVEEPPQPCRFCLDVQQGVCQKAACRAERRRWCTCVNKCGHFCHGIVVESAMEGSGCPPCLKCRAGDSAAEACTVCLEPLLSEPCLLLDCGHVQ